MSNSFPSTGGVKISNIKLVNTPSPDGSYLVEISLDEKRMMQTPKKKADGNCINWPEPLSLASDITDKSILHFKIVKVRTVKILKNSTVGSCQEKVLDLIQQENSGSCKLDISKGFQLMFTIERQGDILPELMRETENPTGTSTSERPVEIANAIMKAQKTATDLDQEDIWTPFLSHFEIFMKTIDTISEIHPYVKLAWSVLSAVPKTIISQKNRNDNINKLLQRLTEVYDYITDATRLPALKETQSKTLSVLVQQTIECTYFLQEYSTSHTGKYLLLVQLVANAKIILAKKILTGASIDEKINVFNEKFNHILDVMTNSVSLEINIVTLRISNDINDLRNDVEEAKDLTLLSELPYEKNAGFLWGKRCLPGTREKLISEILDWVNDTGSQRLLLLLGQAGTGKSAVAHTVSQIFDKQNRLGSVFCFSRSYRDSRKLLFPTISRQLADSDIQWRKNLIPIIQKTSIRTSLDTLTQFEQLIIKPSRNVDTIGPVVIVIDGLDESGDRRERKELLEILFKRCSELPPNYRFVVTSRPESDIEKWCKHPTILYKSMVDIDLNETTKDIQRYISFRLTDVKATLDEELGADWQSLLTKRAEGLFQWASTACDFIDPAFEFGVARRLKFISGSTSSLYQLYHQIFTSQQEFDDSDYLPAFKKILGTLIIARKPLSIQTLQSLFQNDIRDVELIIQPFHSLFLGTRDLHTPIRPLHTFLTDFLTTRLIDIVDDKQEIKTKTKIENQFYIDTSDQGYFTLTCLKSMNDEKTGLRFNICNLETSHVPNRYGYDLNLRMETAIPPHLSYACHFWATHLKHSTISGSLLKELHFLMERKLLYLFEAFSLWGEIEQLSYIPVSTKTPNLEEADSELVKQAEDACQFGYDFGSAIIKSAPHIYLSALPIARKDSFIRKQFLDSFPRHFTIEPDQSPGSLCNPNVTSMKRNTFSTPSIVIFSPQGKDIATGFSTGEIWLWDYRTGEMIHQWGLQRERSSGISSIVYSPNGESVTACLNDSSIEIWNIERGELVSCFHNGSSDRTTCRYPMMDGTLPSIPGG